jgi:hypothetical protein
MKPIRHGTYLGYTVDKCREECCRAPYRIYYREEVARLKREKEVPIPPEMTGLTHRLVQRIEVADGHWLWRGHLDSFGYGRMCGRSAHRLIYTLMVGTIPDGLEIDHLCRVRNCVNPEHLEAVTPLVNNLRAVPFKNFARGEAHHHARLTEDDVREIRRLYRNRLVGPAELSRRYATSVSNIETIIAGRTWKHVS